MKKSLVFNISFLLISLVLFIGCGGSKYNYVTKPTPIKEGDSKYYLSKLNFKLDDDKGENSKYKNESELKKSFVESINKHLAMNNIKGTKDDFSVEIDMTFWRNYYYLGSSKNRDNIKLPYFEYSYKIFDKSKKLLATYSIPQSAIKYGTFEGGHAIVFQILAFQRDQEHEPEDVNHISKYLVKNILEMGE
ncbi:MAG: hypothetical protein GY932_00425 [Arcobacter sp.]|nr:hypothetical protein [Arcobacter sp.]